MSIANELNRIISAKSDIRDAIIAKGVSVPSAATIDSYADYVSQISGGGGGETFEIIECHNMNPYKLSGIKFEYEQYGETKVLYHFTELSQYWDYTGDCVSDYDEAEEEPFYIEAVDNIEFQFNPDNDGLYYTDDYWGDWTYYDTSDPQTITLNAGEKLYIKRNNIKGFGYLFGNDFGSGGSRPDGRFNVGGNIMSLLVDNYDSFLDYGGLDYFNQMMAFNTNFQFLLDQCQNLVSAEHLILVPFIAVGYGYMFYGCSGLTTTPKFLPTTLLLDDCYIYMFKSCSGLTTAPELPATTLASVCYGGMFEGCTSLTTAPELPATTLVDRCYYGMFSDCTSLNYIKCLATDISANMCTDNWVSGVANSGTFVKADSMTDWTTSIDGIPSGWTVVNESDE